MRCLLHVLSHTAELNFLASIDNDIISHTGESLTRQKQDSYRKSCNHFKSFQNISVQILDHEGRQLFVISTTGPSKMLRHLSGSGLTRRRPLASKLSCEIQQLLMCLFLMLVQKDTGKHDQMA